MSNQPILLAICGMAGSGKSTVREFFYKHGFEYIKFGVTEMVISKFGETNEKLERQMREELRAERGMGVMAAVALPKIKGFMGNGTNVLIDNMYSWSEYKILKQNFQNKFITVAVLANPALRHSRLLSRVEDSGRKYTSNEEILSRDYAEIENIEKGGPIAMADYYIVNEGTEEELQIKVQEVFNKIKLVS
jgi:dephospho-CoA kinase